MTAYTMVANGNLRDVGNTSIMTPATARSGGDTWNTAGFKITIDQDVRYGLSGTTSATFGSLTIDAAKGGEIHIDGTKVWMIPFTGGSGTLTLGTQITIGGVTCNTIGIYTSLTVAPATTGASGWLKVTNASGTPTGVTSGTYAGFTLTANGAPIRGFIEVNGDEAGSIIANRLGTFRVTGEWFSLGTTNATAGQTFQIPTNGALRHIAGVYIEKTVGSADYEFYANAGTVVFTGSTVGIANDATRGKVCWITNTGLVTLGNGGGTGLNGYVPVTGLKVVVPNIFFENAATATRTANVIPSATIATRYDFTCTGGGVLEIDKGNFAWYMSAQQAYSVNISNSGFIDTILLQEVATQMTITKVGVGNKPTTALLTPALTFQYCYAGGTFTDCVWSRVSLATTGQYIVTIQDIAGFTFVNNTARANTTQGHASVYSWYVTRAKNCVWTSPKIIQGGFQFVTCDGITCTDTQYTGVVVATTSTTYAQSVW